MPVLSILPNCDCTVDGINRGHFLDLSHNDSQPTTNALGATVPGGALHADIKAAVDVLMQGFRDQIAALERALQAANASQTTKKATP